MARKLAQVERTEKFDFPLRTPEDNQRLEECTSKPQFVTKIVSLFLL